MQTIVEMEEKDDEEQHMNFRNLASLPQKIFHVVFDVLLLDTSALLASFSAALRGAAAALLRGRRRRSSDDAVRR